jgi:hypothetical protein
MNKNVLIEKAKKVLGSNWTGSFTKPSPKLYPHQWNWDSGFISIGYSHFDQKKARTELESLFKGQWKNGMLPHIVFHNPSNDYFPDAKYWKIDLSNDAPEYIQTSGITQPPIHATAVWNIYNNAEDKKDALQFISNIFTKLISSHRFLYNYRDVEKKGLIANIHPWETGIDNSPKWDMILKSIDTENVKIPPFKRKDLNFVSSEERPSDEAYLKFIYLMELFKQCKYKQEKICEESPFLVYDVLFNSILYKANLDLLKIAVLLKEDTKEIEEWIERGKKAFEEILWCDKDSMYHSYDLTQHKIIRIHTASCASPLYASIPSKDRALNIKEHLFTTCPFHQEDICVSIPTFHNTQEGFNASQYWRGPIWININWIVYKGLLNYGFKDLAHKIGLNTIRLINELGFWEYFYPTEMKGLGSNNFSWTAALLIDILYEEAGYYGNWLSGKISKRT